MYCEEMRRKSKYCIKDLELDGIIEVFDTLSEAEEARMQMIEDKGRCEEDLEIILLCGVI